MLATLVDPQQWLEAEHAGWSFERKLDGLRAVAVRDGRRIELWSRNHNSFLDRFPEVAEELAAIDPDRAVLDGEIVVSDGNDFLGFGQLQQRRSGLRVVYCLFDLLHLSGQDTRSLPQGSRKDLLGKAIASGPHIEVVADLHQGGRPMLDLACARGWEGLIAKDPASPYVAGRSASWVKLKCSASQEFVIGGWTDPKGARTHLGALLVGYYEGDALRYAGKVGTGFDSATLGALARELASLEVAATPFSDPVRERGLHWVAPRLVANVAFSEWTRDGRLRHPRFEGLRPDKEPRNVVREIPSPPAD